MCAWGSSTDLGGDIAIVGMALKVPGADGVDDFWRNLSQGIESIQPQSEEDLLAAGEDPGRLAQANYVRAAALLDKYDHFDPDFFGFGPKEAAILDPQHRKFLEVSWEAMEQAGHVPGQFKGRVGVYAGCGMGSYFYFNICSNPDLVDDVGMFLLRHTGNDKDFLSTRVSHVFDLKGPSLNIQTACSTSLVAVHQARAALMRGECDMALAGGVTIELPQGRGYLYKENEILSPDGHCHAFDHRAQGTVFGSGAGAVALRRLEDALADGDHIWAVIKGSAINNDGAAKAGYLAPSVDGQAEAVRAALSDAGLPPESIGYVECHGTGTYLGDPIEVAALTEAFGGAETPYCGIGSVKTNIGHLDTAAGVVSLIKTSLSLYHKQLVPSLGYEAPNPSIAFEGSPFRVSDRLTDWAAEAPRRAGVNSLGVGGTNAHVVLEEAPARAASEPSDWPYQILTLSAKSAKALDANASVLADWLRRSAHVPLADVAYTLKTARGAFDKRRVVVARSHAEAADLLEAGDPRRVFSHERLGAEPDVVFMFPGGGAQYAGMARDLYETEPVFRDWMERGLAHLETRSDFDIRAVWLPEPGQEAEANKALLQPSVQLPLIMIVEYALAQLWMSWGVRPAALVGHSMGENTAACLAGVMGFEDCIDLVLLRGQLFDRVPAGGMLSVSLGEAALRAYLADAEALDMASVNAPELCAVSGPDAALAELGARLTRDGVEFQRIAIDIAAHSRMLEPILEDYRAFLASIPLAAPQMEIISNRSGEALRAEEATDPEYWVGQLRNTVRFDDCLRHLGAKSDRVFLEVGPGKALSALAGMQPAVKPGQVLSSLRHPEDKTEDDAHFLRIIGRLWATGVEADWDQIWGNARRNRVVLPSYAFQQQRFFIEPGRRDVAAKQALVTRHEDLRDWGYSLGWKPAYPDIEADALDRLAEAPRCWLVFSDTGGIADRLVTRLRAAGHRVATVASGDSFLRRGAGEYVIAPEVGRDGYDALLAGLAEDGMMPDRVAHFWLVTESETFRPGGSFFDRNLEHGFYGLFHLTQALEEARDDGAPVHVTAFTNGAAQVGDEPLPWPEKAMISGVLGVAPREMPGLSMASVDLVLGGAAEREALADRLLEELLAEPANARVAYRDGRRYVAGLRPEPLPDMTRKPAEFRAGGTYLITGGLGGIGLSVARYLAREYSACIASVSRRSIPPREDWDDYIARTGGTGPVAAKLIALREIEALGGEVRVFQGDVTDLAAMQEIRDQLCAERGAVTGVIHAAGHVDDAPLLAKDVAQVQAVLAPKVAGLRVLDTVFPDGSLDLMLLFSSTSTIITPAGQVDYVAANEYLNAFAQSRRGGKTKVCAVNWGVWAETGMAAEAVAARTGVEDSETLQFDLPLLRELTPGAEGGDLLRAELDGARDWVLSEHKTRRGQIILPGTGTVELAAEALAAKGFGAPYALRDLMFLRPLDVAGRRKIEIALTPEADGLRFELSAEAQAEGRRGQVAIAEAQLAPLDPAERPGRVDPPAIEKRCAEILPQPFRSPQMAHLEFGPRWDVVREARFGAGEGIARLALGSQGQKDLDEGIRLHPALMDLATGWAIGLVPGYQGTHLWAPMSYGAIRIWGKLPAEIISWVRLRDGADRDSARFDITLCGADGAVYAEIEDFQMRRLAGEGGFALAPVAARDVRVADAAQAPLSRAEERLAQNVARGITAKEGAEALARGLSLGRSQLFISSLDLPALCAEAAQPQEAAGGAGQSFERPELDSEYAAPEGEIETGLAELWQAVLGIEEIGAEDSFFDLGGHSLLAVRLFAQVKRSFGVEFPISVLFEAPTIRALAAKVEASGGQVAQAASKDRGAAPKPAEVSSTRYLVPLHSGTPGPGAPLYIVAGMFGNVMNLRHMAALLGKERPVFGLQARGLVGDEAPHERIEEAAADYIAELRREQPEGPYHLAGFSGGGITAYEIAQQLSAAGQEVGSLILLDTPLPVRPSLSRFDKALIKLHELRRKGPGYFAEWLRNRIEWQAEKRRRAAQREAGAEAGGFDNAGIERAFLAAVGAYEAKPWDGAVTLFRPRLDRHWPVSGGNFVSREREYVFEDNQWRPLAPKLEVIEVPGDHDSMVLVPNVSVLARHIGDALRAADGPRGQAVGFVWPNRTAAE